jgi:hypothetical protein
MLKFFLISFLLTSMAHGQSQYFIELIEEENQFIVAEFEVQPGKLQEKIKETKFVTKELAKIFFEKKLKSTTQVKANQKLVSTEALNQTLWAVENEWSLEFEKKYQEWFAATMYDKFFYDRGIHTDCADAAYMSRWIFSRIHKLPMANTLAGSMILFTQDSLKTEWLKLPTHENWEKDKRFIAALNYLANNTYTKTIFWDLYPVAITRESLAPGTVQFLGGHTLLIYKIDDSGNDFPIYTINSTVPRELRILTVYPMASSDATPQDVGGLMQFRWPIKKNNKWILIPKKEMPWYSTEQYDLGEGNFAINIIKKLNIHFDIKIFTTKLLNMIQDMISERIQIVKNGYEFCQKNNCTIGSVGYEDHSTPSRDKRMYEQYQSIEGIISSLSGLDENIWPTWNMFLSNQFTIEDKQLSYRKFFEFFSWNAVSSDPNEIIKGRWGLDDSVVLKLNYQEFEKIWKERSKFVEEGLVCFPNKCDFSSQQFKKFNTFELDQKLNTFFDNFYSYCSNSNHCRTDLSYSEFQFMQKSQFIVSDPNYSKKLRLGDHLPANFSILPPHESFFPLNKQFLILDKKLYSVAEKKFLKTEYQILDSHNLFERNFMMIKDNDGNLKLLNDHLKILELNLTKYEHTSYLIAENDEKNLSMVVTNTQNYQECQIILFKIQDEELLKKDVHPCQYNQILTFNDKHTEYYYLQDQNKLIFPFGEKFNSILLPFNGAPSFEAIWLNHEEIILDISIYNDQTEGYEYFKYLFNLKTLELTPIKQFENTIESSFPDGSFLIQEFVPTDDQGMGVMKYHLYKYINNEFKLLERFDHNLYRIIDNRYIDQLNKYVISFPFQIVYNYSGEYKGHYGDYLIHHDGGNSFAFTHLENFNVIKIKLKGEPTGSTLSNDLHFIVTLEEIPSINEYAYYLYNFKTKEFMFPVRTPNYSHQNIKTDMNIVTLGSKTKVVIEN